MKKFITCIITMLVTGMVWGQTDEITISGWEIPKPSIYSGDWSETMKFTSTKANLKHGVGDLIVSDVYNYYATGCSILGSILVINNESRSFKRGAGVAIMGGSVGFIIASHVHRRRGLKRLYWGMNGITIPLNQE